MNQEVKVRPNVPMALEALVHEAVGTASVCWKEVDDGERIFDTEKALDVAADLVAHIERAFDAREQPLLAHLRSLSYNLGQLAEQMGEEYAAQPYFHAARDATQHVIDLLEQGR